MIFTNAKWRIKRLQRIRYSEKIIANILCKILRQIFILMKQNNVSRTKIKI